MNTITLKNDRDFTLLKKHPWIFSGAVAKTEGHPENGETVRIVGSKGAFLAFGAWCPSSSIAVKVWTFNESETVDEAFFERRIETAFRLRQGVFAGCLPDAFRLVNAESDGLPGLIADKFGDFIVCQFTGAGAEFHRRVIAEILGKYAGKGVYERSDVESRQKDGLESRTGVLLGENPPDRLEFTENGVRFQCDVKQGHKTGFYLDQRFNRKEVMEAAAGAESVLNCFSYTGGFGLSALRGGAKHVMNVDSSEPALKEASDNAALNGFAAESFETACADVFQYLRLCRDSRKTFDLIVLDPPKFAESYTHKEKAARGYKDINLLAMKLLRPGGKLFTFSCSGAMDDVLFGKVVESAALDAGADFRIVKWLSQGPDHPVSAFFPEGRYLKGLYGIRC